MQHIIGAFPEEDNEAFRTHGYTIGGMMVFPAHRVDGKLNINGARGFNRKIADRFDLTLECVRRYYCGDVSPLGETLARYPEFFTLFDNFDGYVDFFLLQDLIADNGASVKFFMPFDDFQSPSVPRDEDTYKAYRDHSVEFIHSRNRRIDHAINRRISY